MRSTALFGRWRHLTLRWGWSPPSTADRLMTPATLAVVGFFFGLVVSPSTKANLASDVVMVGERFPPSLSYASSNMEKATRKTETIGNSMDANVSPDEATIDRLTQQMKYGHEAWMDRIREMQAVEAEFTQELLSIKEPNEALKICNRWMTRRLELLSEDAKAFAGFWVDLVMTAASNRTIPDMKETKNGGIK